VPQLYFDEGEGSSWISASTSEGASDFGSIRFVASQGGSGSAATRLCLARQDGAEQCTGAAGSPHRDARCPRCRGCNGGYVAA
jgi:hypothetical protein